MQDPQKFIQQLCEVDSEAGKAAWNQFYCDVDLVRMVTSSISTEQASQLLDEGARWLGEGLNTSKASRRLYEASSVAMVAAEFKSYKEAFLFSLALTWGIEIPTFSLTDKASEAAFALSQAYWDYTEEELAQDPARAQGREEEEAERLVLPWEDKEEEPPAELAFIRQEVQQGRRCLDIMQALEGIPRF